MTRRTSPWCRAVAALVATLAVSGCAAVSGEPQSGPRPSPAPTIASPGETKAPVPARPRVGACYDLDFDEATEPTNDKKAVPCKGRHTAQTYYVGRLDTVVDGHLLAVDSERAQRQVSGSCPRHLGPYVGGADGVRALSRIRSVWFSPTIEQSDRGASWFRCDAVAIEREGTLAPLPRRLRGILDRSGALKKVGLCGTAEPGSRGFQRVICSRRHAWKALSTISIPGSTYPGESEVRQAGEDDCRDQVRRATGTPERFSYGWEWPTREQWRSGQHFGFCWAPD